MVDSKVTPTGFRRDDQGRIVVDVHQVVDDMDGNLLSDGQVRHIYTFRDGLVERMDIVDEAA